MTEQHQHNDPVLVDPTEAHKILGVAESTFARLCREGRFEDWGGRFGLYRSAELRRYREAARLRSISKKPVTNGSPEPSNSATFRVPSETKIDANTGSGLPATAIAPTICVGCGGEFRARRVGMKVCGSACRKRAARQRAAQ